MSKATYTAEEFADLSAADKKAIKTYARVAVTYEPLSKAYGVGLPSMNALLAKGLAEEGPPSRHGDRTFKLTDKGWLANEWLEGRKTAEFPSSSMF